MRLVVAGNLCTYGVKFDGSVWSVGDGLHGRLGHGSGIGETSMRQIGALQGELSYYEHGLIILFCRHLGGSHSSRSQGQLSNR